VTGSYLRPSLDSTSSQVTDDQSESERGDDMAGGTVYLSAWIPASCGRSGDLKDKEEQEKKTIEENSV